MRPDLSSEIVPLGSGGADIRFIVGDRSGCAYPSLTPVELDAPIVAGVRAFGLFSKVCVYGRTRQLRHHNLYALNETRIKRDPKSPQISSMWRSQGEQVSKLAAPNTASCAASFLPVMSKSGIRLL
jgi:hypothetical protein